MNNPSMLATNITKEMVSKIRYSSEYFTCPVGNHQQILSVWLSCTFSVEKYFQLKSMDYVFFHSKYIIQSHRLFQLYYYCSRPVSPVGVTRNSIVIKCGGAGAETK